MAIRGKMRFLTKRRWAVRVVLPGYFLLQCIIPTALVFADTDYNSYCVQIGCSYYDPTSTVCDSSSVSLSGKDNEERAWNFFKSKGLGDVATAAVIGNLMLESSMNPQRIQGGGESKNPADAGSGGWGIAQWTPGAKIVEIASNLKVTGAIYELSTQLDIVWKELTGSSPTGVQNVAEGLKKFTQESDLASAVEYFRANFEGGIQHPSRLSFAQEALEKYGNSPTGPATSSVATNGCASSSLSPDCQNASGVAKILCAAKQYDTVSYSMTIEGGHQGAVEWHKSCPVVGPSCILDCSGLVNVAVYDVYGTDLRENTDLEAANAQNWKHIPFNELQPGDLVQPHAGHVEIVDHVRGNVIYTFGAHSSHYPQPRQVGPSSFPVTSTNLYLHYVGPGSEAQ
jgi:cell wall-associated NlpC family hydrolase